MAFTWDWNEKVGEAEIYNYDKVITYNLYKGNAFLIFVYEWEEDGQEKYIVHRFFADESHAKIMLGLTKDSSGDKSNCFNIPGEHPYRLQKIRLDANKYGLANTKKLVGMLAQVFDNITIEFYKEDTKDANNA